MRARAKYVYLFKNFQCILNYPFKFRPGKYKWTVISFSARIFIKSKCQVSLVVKYISLKEDIHHISLI